MRTGVLPLLLGASVLVGVACRSQQPVPQPEYRPTATVKDIMDSMVDPSADFLWESVATIVSAAGTEERAPRTDKEWADVRRRAVIVIEATNLLQIPGRHIARPGEKSENPGIELNPEEIEALVNQDRQTFINLAHGLHDAGTEALKAIDAKNAQGLMDAGERLDMACESCHLKYWYPSEAAAAKRKAPR